MRKVLEAYLSYWCNPCSQSQPRRAKGRCPNRDRAVLASLGEGKAYCTHQGWSKWKALEKAKGAYLDSPLPSWSKRKANPKHLQGLP